MLACCFYYAFLAGANGTAYTAGGAAIEKDFHVSPYVYLLGLTTVMTGTCTACLPSSSSDLAFECLLKQCVANTDTIDCSPAVAFGPMVLAPLSEDLGRKYIYITSCALYTILFLPQALAHNIEALIITRFFQGLAVRLEAFPLPGSGAQPMPCVINIVQVHAADLHAFSAPLATRWWREVCRICLTPTRVVQPCRVLCLVCSLDRRSRQ